jgi:multicomponent Na+:H+ antiporter subunit E
MRRHLSRIALLVGLWLLAWGSVSPATVLSGIVLAGGMLIAFPVDRSRATIRIRPVGAVRLVLYVLGQLVTSNVLVARQILSRDARVHTGVLAYDVQHPTDGVITLMANVIGLTPGTMTVEATRDPGRIYVHFLLLDDVDKARKGIARLERLAVGAIGDGEVADGGSSTSGPGETP